MAAGDLFGCYYDRMLYKIEAWRFLFMFDRNKKGLDALEEDAILQWH
jgi:hypothetical protein